MLSDTYTHVNMLPFVLTEGGHLDGYVDTREGLWPLGAHGGVRVRQHLGRRGVGAVDGGSEGATQHYGGANRHLAESHVPFRQRDELG